MEHVSCSVLEFPKYMNIYVYILCKYIELIGKIYKGIENFLNFNIYLVP